MFEIRLGHGFLGNAADVRDIAQVETLEQIPAKLAEMIKNYHGEEPITEIEIRLDMETKHKYYPDFGK